MRHAQGCPVRHGAWARAVQSPSARIRLRRRCRCLAGRLAEALAQAPPPNCPATAIAPSGRAKSLPQRVAAETVPSRLTAAAQARSGTGQRGQLRTARTERVPCPTLTHNMAALPTQHA
eukprot:scaffold132070_cov32-Tisochrysis_lutea.AAC.1